MAGAETPSVAVPTLGECHTEVPKGGLPLAVAAGQTAFPSSDWTCWSPRPGTDSDHPRGRACDVTFGNAIGQGPTPAQREEGWRFARWLRDHAHELNVHYVIWQARIWNIDRDEEGWRAYGGGGIHDPTSVTGGHIDHVHVSLSR